MSELHLLTGGHLGGNEPEEPLFPDIEVNEKTEMSEQQLQTLQNEADEEGLLLPTQYNVKLKQEVTGDKEDEPLLPTGF